MKTIVFYVKHVSMLTSWVDPIEPFLGASGYRIVVLHASELNRDSSLEIPDRTYPYKTIEITGKGMTEIIEIIRRLAPCAVVMFTFRSLFDLLLLRLCRFLNVRSVYVQHGFHVSTAFTMANKRASVIRYYHIIRWYISFLARAGRKSLLRELYVVCRAMFRADYRAVKPDRAIFYSPSGFRAASGHFEFERNEALFSGYPIMRSRRELENVLEQSSNKREYIVYIHQPFVLDGYTHIDHEQEFAYLRRIAGVCRRHGYELVVKIHPRESIDRYRDGLAGANVAIDAESSIVDVVKNCYLVIGHFSTALFTGVLLNKPIILMDYPGLDKYYYSLFEPVGVRIRNDTGLDELLSNADRLTARMDRYRAFADDKIGTDNTYEHEAQVITQIVEEMVT